MNHNDCAIQDGNMDELKQKVMQSAQNIAIEKYNILLSVLNDILENAGKEKIKEVSEFKKIKKTDIEKEANQLILVNKKKILEDQFGKYSIVLRNIKKEHRFLVYLKHMCNNINLNLKTSKILLKKKDDKYTSTNVYTISDI